MIGLKYSMNYDIQNDRPKIFLEHRRDEDLLLTFGVKHLGGIYIPLLSKMNGYEI